MSKLTSRDRWPSIRRVAAGILVSCAAFAGVVHAQPAPATPDAPAERPDRGQRANGQQRPGARVFEQMQKTIVALDLNADQASQVRDIVRSARQEMQSKAQDLQTMDPRDRLSTMRETLTDLETKIGAVLTPDQKKTFDARNEEMHRQLQATAGGQNRRDANAAANLTATADGGTTQPATRPANGQPAGRGGMLMARVERALEAAQVTPEQKAKIDPILADAKDKMLKIIADNNGDRQAMQQQIRDAREDVATKMADVLTPEQLERFRAAMQPARGQNGGGRPGADRPAMDKPADKSGDKPADAPATMPAADKPPEKPAAMAPADRQTIAQQGIVHEGEAGKTGLSLSPAATTKPASAKLAVGDPLPAFSLLRLDGRTVDNKSLAGKPSVIVFGSYTAASFRDRVPQLQQLAKRLGTRANWTIVYTREQHPSESADQPERNRDDKIEVAKHVTVQDRTAAARLAKQRLEITLDVVPDAIDDALTTALDGFPNASLVFGADGKLVARQNWAEPFAIERAVQAALEQMKKR